MFNFEHEIESIKDRYLTYFFAYDYFHDGGIHSIEFCDHKDALKLLISCEREWAQDNNPDIDRFDDKYLYNVYFERCMYFNSEINGPFQEYINGRFKKSAKLEELSLKTKRRLYHLRIQVSGGFIDIIFSRFSIKKVSGEEIKIPSRIGFNPFETLNKKFKNLSIEQVRDIASKGDWFDSYCALQYLALVEDKDSVSIALNELQREDEFIQIAAIYALGKLGDKEVLPVLVDLWLKETHPIFRRHIQDAIEHLTKML